MLTKETFRVALAAIRANSLRSALTALGIIIGVGAVIAMVALGDGAQARVEAQIAQMGTNVLTVRPGQAMSRGVSRGDAQLSVDDAEALRDNSDHLLTIAPEVRSRQQVTYLRWNAQDDVIGTWPSYFDLQNFTLAEGRIFTLGEVQGKRRVAVLGSDVPAQLETAPSLLIGRTIQIRGVPFEVVGVLEEKGSMGFSKPDDDIFIPLSTAQYRVAGGGDKLSAIYAGVVDDASMDAALATIDQIMRREHRLQPGEEADFNISNAADLVATFNEANQTFTLLLSGIAAVSLLVGGIGIMNIMLVSVTERTREIGVRKALGASRLNILMQFLVEALMLCTLGGLLGAVTGFGGARLLTELMGWATLVHPTTVAVAIAFSAAIGLFFGIMPARRAARLDPIEALRYE